MDDVAAVSYDSDGKDWRLGDSFLFVQTVIRHLKMNWVDKTFRLL